MVNAAQQILIFGVRFYRRILSPAKTALLGPAGRCRFEPSCSAYALKEEHATRSEQSFGQSNPSSDCTTENERATAASY